MMLVMSIGAFIWSGGALDQSNISSPKGVICSCP